MHVCTVKHVPILLLLNKQRGIDKIKETIKGKLKKHHTNTEMHTHISVFRVRKNLFLQRVLKWFNGPQGCRLHLVWYFPNYEKENKKKNSSMVKPSWVRQQELFV